MNLLSNDVYRFDAMSMFLNAMWTAPLLVVTVGYLLWVEIQWAGMFGLLVVFIIVPIQSKSRFISIKFKIKHNNEYLHYLQKVMQENFQ